MPAEQEQQTHTQAGDGTGATAPDMAVSKLQGRLQYQAMEEASTEQEPKQHEQQLLQTEEVAPRAPQHMRSTRLLSRQGSGATLTAAASLPAPPDTANADAQGQSSDPVLAMDLIRACVKQAGSFPPAAQAAVISKAHNRPNAARKAIEQRGGKATSKLRGVTHHIRTSRWEAHIWESGKQVYLGGYGNEALAGLAHDLAVKKLRPADTPTNYLLSGPEIEAYLNSLNKISSEDVLSSLRAYSKELACKGNTAPKVGRPSVSRTLHCVVKHSNGTQWEARLPHKAASSKFRHLGMYGTEEEAARAYDVAAIQEFDTSSALPLNFPVEQYAQVLPLETIAKYKALQEAGLCNQLRQLASMMHDEQTGTPSQTGPRPSRTRRQPALQTGDAQERQASYIGSSSEGEQGMDGSDEDFEPSNRQRRKSRSSVFTYGLVMPCRRRRPPLQQIPPQRAAQRRKLTRSPDGSTPDVPAASMPTLRLPMVTTDVVTLGFNTMTGNMRALAAGCMPHASPSGLRAHGKAGTAAADLFVLLPDALSSLHPSSFGSKTATTTAAASGAVARADGMSTGQLAAPAHMDWQQLPLLGYAAPGAAQVDTTHGSSASTTDNRLRQASTVVSLSQRKAVQAQQGVMCMDKQGSVACELETLPCSTTQPGKANDASASAGKATPTAAVPSQGSHNLLQITARLKQVVKEKAYVEQLSGQRPGRKPTRTITHMGRTSRAPSSNHAVATDQVFASNEATRSRPTVVTPGPTYPNMDRHGSPQPSPFLVCTLPPARPAPSPSPPPAHQPAFSGAQVDLQPMHMPPDVGGGAARAATLEVPPPLPVVANRLSQLDALKVPRAQSGSLPGTPGLSNGAPVQHLSPSAAAAAELQRTDTSLTAVAGGSFVPVQELTTQLSRPLANLASELLQRSLTDHSGWSDIQALAQQRKEFLQLTTQQSANQPAPLIPWPMSAPMPHAQNPAAYFPVAGAAGLQQQQQQQQQDGFLYAVAPVNTATTYIREPPPLAALMSSPAAGAQQQQPLHANPMQQAPAALNMGMGLADNNNSLCAVPGTGHHRSGSLETPTASTTSEAELQALIDSVQCPQSQHRNLQMDAASNFFDGSMAAGMPATPLISALAVQATGTSGSSARALCPGLGVPESQQQQFKPQYNSYQEVYMVEYNAMAGQN